MMTPLIDTEELPSGTRLSRNWIVAACLVVIAVCVGGAALMFMRDIFTPLLIAIFLYFLIQPVVQTFFRWKLPPWLLYPLFVLLPLAFIQIVVTIVDYNVRSFAQKLPVYRDRLEDISVRTADFLGYPNPENAFDWVQASVNDFVQRSGETIARGAFDMTLLVIEVSVLAIFYLLFMFLEARKFHGRVRQGFDKGTADRIVGVLNKIDHSIRQYLWIKTAVSFGLGVTTSLLCWVFGLDFWLLWGLLIFLGNYVTYVGSMVALAPPIALAFVQFPSPFSALALTVLLIVNRLFWIDYAEIKYSGEHLDVSPLLLLLSIAVLYMIWGVVGMLLAVPLVTTVKIILSHFDNTRYIAKLMSDD